MSCAVVSWMIAVMPLSAGVLSAEVLGDVAVVLRYRRRRWMTIKVNTTSRKLSTARISSMVVSCITCEKRGMKKKLGCFQKT